MNAEEKGTVQPLQDGQRLDRALELFFPDLGLRARRRLCERGAIFVDNIMVRPGFRVRTGQLVSFIPTRDRWDDKPLAQVRVVSRTEHMAALYKPRGLHTAWLAGSEAPCVEECLGELFGATGAYPRLVNRLDLETSGLVAAALDASGANLWLSVENAGLVHKSYLAIACGRIEQEFEATAALDTADRRISRPMDNGPCDPLRCTKVIPLAYLDSFTTPDGADFSGPLTLVGCRIRKGARHQIRAHLALHGAPLAGDSLYGSSIEGPFFLHHAAFAVREFQASAMPDWLDCLPEAARESCEQWLLASMQVVE